MAGKPKVNPQFRNLARQVTSGLVLAPILTTYLHDAKYPPEFNVAFSNHGGSRAPDGWFHPSTHPRQPARQLYYYMAEPEKVVSEPLEYMGALSTTMGTAIHGFVQMCLKDQGCLVDDEVYVENAETRSRGSMDGVLQLPSYESPVGFEFKTSNQMKLNGIVDNDVEAFRHKWPHYYSQVTEYMRISGLRKFIVLFMAMGYPWTLKEFQIDYDLSHAMEIETKYRQVLHAVEHQEVPDPCCLPGSAQAKACGARFVCPVGLA